MSFTEPDTIGNTYGPGRSSVVCLSCGAVVLVPRPGEPDWLDVHEASHQPLAWHATIEAVLALCERWDSYTKGESPTTAAIRACLPGRTSA